MVAVLDEDGAGFWIVGTVLDETEEEPSPGTFWDQWRPASTFRSHDGVVGSGGSLRYGGSTSLCGGLAFRIDGAILEEVEDESR